MKSTLFKSNSRASGFTLVEMLIVITIISLLAAMTMGGYTYAMRSSRRRVTTGTFEAIKLALERYNTDFGEYPQPSGSNLMQSFPPGQTAYDISGAACLYQALTGDGYDQIKGVTSSSSSGSNSGGSGGSSDGKIEGATEIKNKMLADVPQTIFTKKSGTYILVDGFGHPFQYLKPVVSTNNGGGGAANNNTTVTTINATYDLWSYAEDDKNTSKQSADAMKTPTLAVKWIKNW